MAIATPLAQLVSGGIVRSASIDNLRDTFRKRRLFVFRDELIT